MGGVTKGEITWSKSNGSEEGKNIERDGNKSSFKKKGLNILIVHAPWNDRGDEAAIRAMVDSLKSKLCVGKMRMMMMCKTAVQFPYDDIEIIEMIKHPLLFPKGKAPKVTFALNRLNALLMIFTFGKLSLTKGGREFIKVVDEADVVIHAPGGADIGDLYGRGGLLGPFSPLFELLISKVKSKPFFFYAPSMGPFSGKFLNFIRRYLLERADALIVREEISAMYLRVQLGLDSYVTVDSSLQNDIPEDYVSKYITISEIFNIIENEKVIGITITDVKWHPIHGKNRGLGEKIKSSFVDLIRYLIKGGYVILLVPILFGERLEEQDVGLLEGIYSLFKKEKETKKKIFFLPSNVDAYAQQLIISKLFCVISVRYHGIVFSVKGGVPFISISYEDKIKGFIEKIGFTDLMINVEEISADNIIDKFTYLEENYDIIRERLRDRGSSLKEESRETTRIVLEKLRCLGLIVLKPRKRGQM